MNIFMRCSNDIHGFSIIAVLTSCPLVVNPIIGLQFTYLHDNALMLYGGDCAVLQKCDLLVFELVGYFKKTYRGLSLLLFL